MAATSARRTLVGRANVLTRHYGPDDERTREARRGARAAELAEHIQRIVAQAPPLTPEQITRLRDLLPPVPTPDGASNG
jgi:hypothetical protein